MSNTHFLRKYHSFRDGFSNYGLSDNLDIAHNQVQLVVNNALSAQLAQHDFAERHLLNWAPELVAKVAVQNGDSVYARLLNALNEFLNKDFAWQQSTIS